jgi:hypothetical protein
LDNPLEASNDSEYPGLPRTRREAVERLPRTYEEAIGKKVPSDKVPTSERKPKGYYGPDDLELSADPNKYPAPEGDMDRADMRRAAEQRRHDEEAEEFDMAHVPSSQRANLKGLSPGQRVLHNLRMKRAQEPPLPQF